MRYIHNSPIRHHGHLTSRNCVIDSRWVLKVTDYGLPAFQDLQSIATLVRSAKDLLWTAPELLRDCGLLRRGTQAGDVYSFAIVMQEVLLRGDPYCMLPLTAEDLLWTAPELLRDCGLLRRGTQAGDVYSFAIVMQEVLLRGDPYCMLPLTAEEIIEKLKHPPPLIRPSVSKQTAPPEALHIMRQCWAEYADMRPDFDQIADRFKTLYHGSFGPSAVYVMSRRANQTAKEAQRHGVLSAERLGFYCEANGVLEPTKKRALLLTLCGAKTYEVVRALVAPKTPGKVSFDELMATLKKHYDPRPSELFNRTRLQ
ncbi:putative guanylate cyclase C [Ixodes scapularis]